MDEWTKLGDTDDARPFRRPERRAGPFTDIYAQATRDVATKESDVPPGYPTKVGDLANVDGTSGTCVSFLLCVESDHNTLREAVAEARARAKGRKRVRIYTEIECAGWLSKGSRKLKQIAFSGKEELLKHYGD